MAEYCTMTVSRTRKVSEDNGVQLPVQRDLHAGLP